MEVDNLEAIESKDRQIILISVDSKYFRRHATAWAWSVFQNSMYGHIHIINPSKKDLYNANAIYKNTKHQVSFSSDRFDREISKKNAFLASSRFFVAKDFIDSYKKILITDADSFFLRKFSFPKEEVGIFIREPLSSEPNWVREGTRVASGLISLCGEEGKLFIDQVVTNIKQQAQVLGWKWFIDQFCIWKTYLEFTEKDPRISFHLFSEKDLDWNFNKDSVLWTGKGSRKDLSERYIKKKKELELDYLASTKVKPKRYLFLDFYDSISRNLTFFPIFKRKL